MKGRISKTTLFNKLMCRFHVKIFCSVNLSYVKEKYYECNSVFCCSGNRNLSKSHE